MEKAEKGGLLPVIRAFRIPDVLLPGKLCARSTELDLTLTSLFPGIIMRAKWDALSLLPEFRSHSIIFQGSDIE